MNKILSNIPIIKAISLTKRTSAPIRFWRAVYQFFFTKNRFCYWPVDPNSYVSGKRNIKIGVGCAPGIMPGCYIQGFDKIEVGDYTIMAPNSAIITGNHDIYDLEKHITAPVKIGEYCWVGMNSVILPGVTLGDHVVIAAGSIVNKSFPDGYVVIGGTPAKILKVIEPELVNKYKYKEEYIGYIPKKFANSFFKLYLSR
ncbi:acyltransferase [Pseudoalteromonas shioyasakiensis]|uniref:acyltransferase n=1 Tax=Pseudoalteromonas shioyasakiensis TaxID=1190813 RepID=UPI0025B41979|nr:acyltransferase [Pseudoalteromonas shioyasakiensis]